MRYGWMLILLALLVSCTPKVKRGDVLFRSSLDSTLSSSINKVTGGVGYSHMGIADTLNGKIVVLHASPNGGVHRSSLRDFIREDGVSHRVDVFRIDNPIRNDINSALIKGRSLIGEPYNFTYIVEDDGYYCSEYIYEIFKKDSLFQLEPMTFKNPTSGDFDRGWVNYYRKLDMDIPEGKLGCNPNKMSKNRYLRYIFSFTIDDLK